MSGMKSTLAAALSLLLLSCAEPAPRTPSRVKVDAYLGVEPALYLEAERAGAVMVALPDVAGRVVHYGLDGQNILYTPEQGGKPKAGGGFGLDLGPERTIPPHPVIWNQKHGW